MREVDQLLCVVFNGRRKTGRLDLEAVEMAVRAAMHHAGSAALTELLQFAAPTTKRSASSLALVASVPIIGNNVANRC